MTQAVSIVRPFDGLQLDVAHWKRRAITLWRAHPRETVGFGLLGLIGAGVIAASAFPAPQPAPHAAPPAPPPLLIRNIPTAQALQVNAAIPIAAGPNPAASAFQFKGSAASRAQALDCLASAEYYEAGNQDDDGERAVAQVVLNRVRHPAFPASVCGVVYQGSTQATGCQFTFTCDGSLTRQPDADGWKRAYRIAQEALSGAVYAPVGLATHYHADYVVPVWASSLTKSAIVGAHIFYRWAGGWGQPPAFNEAYAGREPNAAVLRAAALAVPHTAAVVRSGSVADAVDKIPGAEAIKLAPSMRGDKRVAVRFNLVARKASEEAPHEDYAKKFDESDTLKWALSGNAAAADQKPLGKSAAAPSTVTASSVAAASAVAARSGGAPDVAPH